MAQQARAASARQFVVTDERYPNPALSFGWRSPATSDGNALQATLASGPSPNLRATPLLHDWSADPGTDQVTALLPAKAASEWIGQVLTAAAGVGAPRPVSAVVGASPALESAAAAIRHVTFPDQPSAVVGVPSRSVMSQRMVDGTPRVTVTGPDPALRWGGAAAALAIRLTAHEPRPIVADVIGRAGLPVSIRILRALHGGIPSVQWQVDGPSRTALRALEAVLDAAEAGIHLKKGALERAREALLADLRGSWESPVLLARTLTRFEVLGWDGHLVLDPHDSLAAVDPAAVHGAMLDLIQPLAQVLGRTRVSRAR